MAPWQDQLERSRIHPLSISILGSCSENENADDYIKAEKSTDEPRKILEGEVVRSEAIKDNSPSFALYLACLDTTARLSQPSRISAKSFRVPRLLRGDPSVPETALKYNSRF